MSSQHNIQVQLLSPNGSVNADAIHETASNHSGHSNPSASQHYYPESSAGDSSSVATSSVAPTSASTPVKKNFKTEYKAKFKPFSEYAYNEVTDSFVKCHSSNECASGISGSRSNQDLSGAAGSADGATHHQITISTLDADVFEPQHEAGDHHVGGGGSVTEPWYKEVVKRNEKANEYRFKSEVGHNSPLLNYTATTANSRADSPAAAAHSDRTLTSPNGGDLYANGSGDVNLEIRSQHSDQNNETQQQQEQQTTSVAPNKVQYKFTPNSYKRDNLIAHMANNNNFNLPKEETSASSGATNNTNQQQQQPRRAMTASSQARARSQSSRRTPTTSSQTNNTATSVASSKIQSASKSNHTTPTRTLNSTTPRSNITSSMRPTTARTGAAKTTPQTTATSRYATTTTRTPTATSTSTARRTPTVSSTAASRVTPRPTTATRPTTSRTTPTTAATGRTATTPMSSSSVKKTATTTVSATKPASTTRPRTAAPTRPLAAQKPTLSPTKTSGISAGKLPATGARAPLSSRSTAASRDRAAAASAAKTNEDNNAVKSIKTRKAIESETAKAAAAAAAAAGGVAAIAGASTLLGSSTNEPKDTPQEDKSTALPSEPAVSPPVPVTSQPMRFASEEQNLIFTTTESGDMLADELAQAEMAQQAELASKHEQLQSEVTSGRSEAVKDTAREETPSNDDDNKNQAEDDQSGGELINGLAGGLVSAEDRFDSSERDFSVETNRNDNQFLEQQHQQQQQLQQDQNQSDEPYSIIPTTTDRLAEDAKEPVESSVEDVPGRTFEVVTGSGRDTENRAEQLDDIAKGVLGVDLGDQSDDESFEHLEPVDDDKPAEGDTEKPILESTPDKPEGEHQNDEFAAQQPKLGQHIELGDDLMAQEARVETVGLADSTAALIEPVEAPSQSHDFGRVLSDDILSSTKKSAYEPDSTVPAITDIEVEKNLVDSDSDHEAESDNHQDPNENQNIKPHELLTDDNEPPKEVEEFQEKAGDISNDGIFDTTHNLTTSDDGVILSPSNLAMGEERPEPPKRESDSDLMAQDNLMGAAVHAVDNFASEVTPEIQKSEANLTRNISPTSSSGDIEPTSTNQKDQFNNEEEPQQQQQQPVDLGENLCENTAGDIGGGGDDDEDDVGEVDLVADNKSSGSELTPDVTQKISQMNFDDIDNDEHLKLSNNLTNSDDELILKPGNLKSSDEHELTPTPQQDDDDSDSDSVEKETHRGETKTNLMSQDQSEPIESASTTTQVDVDMPRPTTESEHPTSSEPPEESEARQREENIISELDRELVAESDSSTPDIIQDYTQSNLVDFGKSDENIDLTKREDDDTAASNTNDGLILNPFNLSSTIEAATMSATPAAAAVDSSLQAGKHLDRGASDLDLMAQEDRLEGTLELGDGSSAALKVPTSAENRIEMSTSKGTEEPEEPQANFKFARKISDDSEDELDIDLNEDPIGSAATLSPNTSVAEELMRFNAVKDNMLDLEMNRRQISDENYMTDLTLATNNGSRDEQQQQQHHDNNGGDKDDARSRNNNETTSTMMMKDIMESVDVTSHVIDETVKQLSDSKKL